MPQYDKLMFLGTWRSGRLTITFCEDGTFAGVITHMFFGDNNISGIWSVTGDHLTTRIDAATFKTEKEYVGIMSAERIVDCSANAFHTIDIRKQARDYQRQ